MGVDVGISQDRRNIQVGETFALFYQRGPHPDSVDAETDCLALEVHSGPWDQLAQIVPAAWLAIEIGLTARAIEGLRESLQIYLKYHADLTSETVTAIKFRRES